MLVYLAGSILGALFLWLIIVAVIRFQNFNRDGSRKATMRSESSDELRSSQIEYHNKAIYRDFELFFKLSLALVGGTAFLVTRSPDSNPEVLSFLIRVGGHLQLLSSVLFSVFVIAHQKSKIERWPERFSLAGSLAWQECWMTTAMWIIGVVFPFYVAPKLVTLLQ